MPALGPPRPLLGVCLAQALAGWQALEGRQPEHACFLGYLRGLLLPLPEILEWVCQHDGPQGSTVWNPFALLLANLRHRL